MVGVLENLKIFNYIYIHIYIPIQHSSSIASIEGSIYVIAAQNWNPDMPTKKCKIKFFKVLLSLCTAEKKKKKKKKEIWYIYIYN